MTSLITDILIVLAIIAFLASPVALYTLFYYMARNDERSLRYGRFVMHLRVLLLTVVSFFLLLYLLLQQL